MENNVNLNLDLEHESLLEQWNVLLEGKQLRALKTELAEANEVDIAEFVTALEEVKTMLLVYRLLPKEIASDVFANLEPEAQGAIISSITALNTLGSYASSQSRKLHPSPPNSKPFHSFLSRLAPVTFHVLNTRP